jgi:hypothetical protein
MGRHLVRFKSTDISKELIAFIFRFEVSQARDHQEPGSKHSVSVKRQLITTGLYGPTAQSILLIIVLKISFILKFLSYLHCTSS